MEYVQCRSTTPSIHRYTPSHIIHFPLSPTSRLLCDTHAPYGTRMDRNGNEATTGPVRRVSGKTFRVACVCFAGTGFWGCLALRPVCLRIHRNPNHKCTNIHTCTLTANICRLRECSECDSLLLSPWVLWVWVSLSLSLWLSISFYWNACV